MNKKADFGFKVLKKWTSKTEKHEKNAPKQPIFGTFWCIPVTKSDSFEFCLSCKVIFSSFFADEASYKAERLWNSMESGF